MVTGMMTTWRRIWVITAAVLLGLVAGDRLLTMAADRFYTLQVSAYQKAEDAAPAVDRLKKLGLEAFYNLELVPGQGMWYRIFVGAFRQKAEAESYGQRLQSLGIITSYRVMDMGAPQIVSGSSDSPPAAVSTGSVSPPAAYVTAPSSAPPAPITFGSKPPNASVTPPPVSTPASNGPSPSFQKIVYGRYVGSFRDRAQAQREAEGLTRYGWQAIVEEDLVQGIMWYRVYLIPFGQANNGGPGETPGFEIIADMSESPQAKLTWVSDPPSRCPGYTNSGAKIAIVRKINAAVPPTPYFAVLRDLAILDNIADRWGERIKNLGSLIPDEHTRRLWGVLVYSRNEFGRAIDKIKLGNGLAPLVWSVNASDSDLMTIPGRKALILVSDFESSALVPDPVPRTKELKRKYGPSLCVYPIVVDATPDGWKLAEEMAKAGECGHLYDGCRVLADENYFRDMIQDIFGGRGGCPDEDGDGVCDDQDQCPHTPKGALVDSRGCWIAALGLFFDFDRDIVKPEFLPSIQWAADILVKNPQLIVQVDGHTDSMGSDAYNLDLGRRRAEAVYQWLKRYGVDQGRLRVKSYGETRPAADNTTELGRAKNRRVELTVIK